MSTPLLQAKVQHWDSSGISVLCPSCNRTHRHHFDQQMYAGKWRRASDCPKPELWKDYELRFPFDETTGDIGFYVDKINGRYVTIGAQVRLRDDSLRATGSNRAGDVAPWDKRRKWEEGKEEHTLDNTDERFRRLKEYLGGDADETSSCHKIDYAISCLANGDVDWLKEYLNSSPEATLFLQGGDDMGNTALHVAACESWPETVELLLRHNVNINATNAQGRTPLMEAAFWGRLHNVSLLLQNGADWEAMDDEGYSALDFAVPSQKNDDERYDRFERYLHMHQSNTYDSHRRHTERRQIVNILKDREASKTAGQYSSINDAGIEEFKFLTSIERCSISLVKEFPVDKTSKAIARLTFPGTRKNKFPPVDAMSGWKHGDGNEQVVINGKDWTPNVMELATYLNYTLPAGGNLDRGIGGRYYACHAEKQLIAYFVSKHVVLDEDEWYLKEAIPPIMIKRAHIIVSREVCSDCEAFVAFVNRMLGLSLQVTGVGNSTFGDKK